LSATPLVASAAVGIVVVYGHRFSVGDWVEMGGVLGRVRAVRLLDVEIVVDDTLMRVPHLRSLWRPTRMYGRELPIAVLVSIAPGACRDDEARALLLAAAESVGKRPTVELLGLDAEGVLYRVTTFCEHPSAQTEFVSMLAETLSVANVGLGRAGVRLATSLLAPGAIS
jgi:Mechanosensitive ion channel